MNEFKDINRIMLYIILAHLPFFFLIQGVGDHNTYFVYVSSILNSLVVLFAYKLFSESQTFGYVVAISLMVNSAILIQGQMGQTEMHFHIFATMAFLTVYRSWRVILSAAVTIALHHLILTILQMNGVSLFGIPLTIYAQNCSITTLIVHAMFVVFEASALGFMAYKSAVENDTNFAIMDAVMRAQDGNDLRVRAPVIKGFQYNSIFQ